MRTGVRDEETELSLDLGENDDVGTTMGIMKATRMLQVRARAQIVEFEEIYAVM